MTRKASATQARAREENPATPRTREARVQSVMAMMNANEFETGVTYKRLAEQWGMSQQAIRDITAEASRRVAAHVADPDYNAMVANKIVHYVIGKAIEQGMLNTLLNAAKTLRDVTPQPVEVRRPNSPVSMSREERVRFLREALAEEEASLTDSPDSGISKP